LKPAAESKKRRMAPLFAVGRDASVGGYFMR
jgi:hypothetical protein